MQSQSPGKEPPPLSSRQQAKVLLVDDRADNLLVLEVVLADLPVALVKARSGEEALARLLEHDFAVILQDDDRRRTREAGFNAHVVKPIQSAELQKLLGGASGLDQIHS